MKTTMINLYSFSELNEKAKESAISEHRAFELSIMQPSDFIRGNTDFDTPEKLQQEYNTQYTYYLENDEPIIESIELNDYLFFADGSLANCVTYCGNNETELNIGGETYKIK